MKFKIGDKVKIVNYGAPIHEGERIIDLMPELIGQEAIIREAEITQGVENYALKTKDNEIAWFQSNQLEMINPNPNDI